MEFKFIGDELKKVNLKASVINALLPDAESYSILLNQHSGTATANDKFIGNSEATQALARAKFNEFFKIAFDNLYDLVCCPEYSCPWESLKSAISSNRLPKSGKVWVLGMESTTPKDLKAFAEKHNCVTWIYDVELLNANQTKVFLDCSCIFLKAKDENGKLVDVCVVQFKTQHMSVHGVYKEEDYLIEGRYSYVLQNEGNNSVSLFTLICSDSLTFNNNDFLAQNFDKLLIVHLQMNLGPRHHAFKGYRDTIFNGESDKVEIICLNWAKNSVILNEKIPYSGTSYYLKAQKPILEDKRLDDNEDKGMFYSYWSAKKCHTYVFSNAEYLLGFSTHKASQALAPSPLRNREGPVSQETYNWQNDKYELTPKENKFMAYCQTLNCDLGPLANISHVNKERLLKLASATNLTDDFYKVKASDLFGLDDLEIINRLTFVDEPNPNRQAARNTYLMNLKELVLVFTSQQKKFPEELAKLITESKLDYNVGINPFTNVYTKNESFPLGTVCYLGSSTEVKAQEEYDNVNLLYLRSIGEKVKHREKPNIIIWYQDNGLKFVHKSNDQIDGSFDESDSSIDKDRQL